MIPTGWLTDTTGTTLQALQQTFPALSWVMAPGFLKAREGNACLVVRLDVYRRWRVTITVPTGLPSDSTHYPMDVWFGDMLQAIEATRLYLTHLLSHPLPHHPAPEAMALARLAIGEVDDGG